MPLVFPSSPVTGQTYRSGSSQTYQFDGREWTTVIQSPQTFPLARTASFVETADTISGRDSGTMEVGFTATGTAPVKATTRERDYMDWQYVGGFIQIQMALAHVNNAGATNGIGDYLFALPTGYTWDTTAHPIVDTFIQDDMDDYTVVHGMIPGSFGFVQSDNLGWRYACAIPYTSDTFRIVLMKNLGTGGVYGRATGNGNISYGTANWSATMEFFAKVDRA
jgi:hypothetical protein